jgi:hypothetical protein
LVGLVGVCALFRTHSPQLPAYSPYLSLNTPIYFFWLDLTVLSVGYSVIGAIIASRLPRHPLLVAVGGLGGPIAIGVAILRYRLYEIDTLINRTLVYGVLTASLAAVYFGGVATTQAIFCTLTGQEEQQPQLAIVVSTLVIAALFNPIRRRIQAFIDRRFYRRKYDAAKALEAF